MSEVSLRSYLHEIEQYIENGRPDQAIAHCKHILQSYPKCVDTYRLLGNAYLESQRFTDAGDIFQRVISSIPDDIESHIGMSIIREDEGNLDEAIWHMERAFEVQPSNSQIQDELRRLYGKRDNATPPRIRLTRGALTRLYAKGDLFPQAIGEIRAALNENPNRLDLEVLLAETYLKTGKKAEATEIAQSVLRSLPNCISAIKVMILVLSGADREMELISYRQKLALLDPYSAYTSPGDTTSSAVPDQAVSVEQLEWTADEMSEEISGPEQITQPEGMFEEFPSSSQDELPEWLSRLVGDKTSSTSLETKEAGAENGMGINLNRADENITASHQHGEDASEWLDVSGQKATESINSEMDHPIDRGIDLDLTESALEPEKQAGKAELPDWLKAFSSIEEKASPAESITTDLIGSGSLDATGSVAEVRGSESLPDWLIGAGSVGAAAGSLAEMNMEEAGQPLISGPEIQKEKEEAEVKVSEDFQASTIPEDEMQPEEEAAQPAEEIPDWLLELQQEGDQADEVAEMKLEETAMNEDELPDWLRETSSEAENKKSQDEEDEIPDWLRAAQTEEAGSTIKEPEAEIPNWREALETPAPVESSSTAEELPQWLWEEESTEMEEPAIEREQEAPEWLTAAGLTEVVSEELGEKPEEEPIEPELFNEKSLPTWLFEKDVHAPESPEVGAAAVEEDNYLEDTQPTRITGAVEEAESTEVEDLVQPPSEAPVEKIDDFEEAFSWLMGLQAADKVSARVEVEKEVVSDETPLVGDFSVDSQAPLIEEMSVDEEAASTWLENLAVKQNADEFSSPILEVGLEGILDEGETEIPTYEEEVLILDSETAEIEETTEAVEVEQEAPVFADLSETVSNEMEQAIIEGETPDIDLETALKAPAAEQTELTESVEISDFHTIATPAEQVFEALRDEAETPEEIVEEIAPQKGEITLPAEDEISKELTEARLSLAQGDFRQAMGKYTTLILSQRELELIVSDLEQAVKRFPDEMSVWQNLGDVYLRLNRAPEALSAYITAEKLLN